MSAKPPRSRKREATGGSARQSKRPKRDAFEHVAFCSELYNAIKAIRDTDGRPITDSLQRAPSRRNEPEYHNLIEKAIDLSRINQKVNAEEYTSFEDMCADVQLLIQNTLSFYKPETIENQHALLLQSVYNTEKDKILQNASGERSDSRNDRLSSTPSTASTSIKRESSPLPPDEWRMEGVICAILDEHDRDGRLLCPPFRILMSPDAFPMYYQVIKEPIDLQKIANKIREAEYLSWNDFSNDLKLLYQNAKQFNSSSSSIYKDAVYLNNFTKQKLQQWTNAKKPSSADLSRNKVVIDELLARVFESDKEDDQGTSEDSNDEDMHEKLDDTLWKLYSRVRHSEHADPFLVLPDRRLYPDYYEDEDIGSPVSIFLVNSRLKKGKYASLAELVRDLQLMCRNAMVYNIEGSSVHESAVEIDSLIVNTAKELDPALDVTPTVVESEKLVAPQPKPAKKSRPKKPPVEEEVEEEEYQEIGAEEEVSLAPSDTINDSSLFHKPSIGSDDGNNQSDVNSVTSSSPRKKKNRGVPPSRLPGAAETRAQLIPKRSKKNTTGEKMRPGRKSFNELRELYKAKLMEIYKAVTDLKVNGRQVCAEFLFRPDPHKYADYYNVIECPIDMVTIQHRIENGEYLTSEAFAEDFRLLFSNARKFNHPDSQIYADANQLENLVLNTMMRVTNNTVLRYPPPSKRTPNFFDVGSPPGVSPAPAVATPKTKPTGVEKTTPSRAPVPQISPLQVKMNEVLDRICDVQASDGRKLSTLFQKLPSRAEYPDYYNVIKKPMDLFRIRQKLDNNQYDTQRTFFSDLKLVFDNACKFNEPDSQIYKDALTLQQEIIEICAEDTEDDKSIPSVQSQVRRILTNLLVAVNNYTEKGRCLSNSFTEVGDLFRKNGIPVNQMPFTLDQIKTNLDKNRYKRLDRFQDDVFGLFGRVRTVTRPDSQLFLDSIDLQKFFISKREELCKGVLVSPASTFTESDLWDEIEARKKAIKKEGSSTGADTNEADSDTSKTTMEVDESEKPKESGEVLESAEHDGVIYKPKDYVYVAPGEDNAPSDTQKHIFRIESIVRDADSKNDVLLKGIWVFRPSETYHLPTRKFYEKEVFLTPNKESVTLDRLRGRCCVLFLDDYLKYKPTEFDEEDIYVCEYRYLGRKLHFKRFNTWPYPDEIEDLPKEDRPEDFNPQKTMNSEFVSHENSLAPVHKALTVDDEDADERMRNLPAILDIHREEVPIRRKNTREDEVDEESAQNDESKDIVYFEQVFLNGAYYRIGDCVLVFSPKKGQCDVMQISRIWQTPGQGRFFSGMFFCRPKEVEHEPSTCFYKREVIAVEQPERVEPLERIQGRCAILTVKQFTVCRPTEVSECDVFIVDHKVNGDQRAQGQYMTYVSTRNYRKLKTYSWSELVPDDEIYYFKNALNMERKEVSPHVSKVDTTLPVDGSDLDAEERHVNDQIDSPNGPKDANWLANQPKLNAKSKSGYILFSAEVRKRIMAENVEKSFGEVSKMVGAEWKKLSDEQKRQYESRASYIAEERAKNDLLTPHSKVLQPGEIRIFVCRWSGCDFQFDNYDGLFDHVKTSHASAEETKVHEERKVIMPNQRGKHFFQYIPSKDSTTKDNPQGLFICQPNGNTVPNIIAHRTAIPLDAKQPSLPTSPISTTNHSIASSATPGPSTQPPPATPISHHPPGAPAHQVYHVQHTPQPHSTSQPAQVVQVINGSSVAYVNAPYQTVIVNQPVSGAHHQVVTSSGHPTGQILVQHTVGQPIHGHSTPHQIVVHGPPGAQSSQPSTIIQPGQGYAQHNAPGPVHVYGSSGTQSHGPPTAVPYYTPAAHQPPPAQHYQLPAGTVHSTPPPQQQLSHAEAAQKFNKKSFKEMVVTASSRPEPLFIPPPNSIKVKHVLHSEIYLRYIESLSQSRQKTVSNYDRSLQQNQYNTRVDRRKLPTDWLDKNKIGKKRDDEIVQALWKLRDNLLESVVGIRRDHTETL